MMTRRPSPGRYLRSHKRTVGSSIGHWMGIDLPRMMFWKSDGKKGYLEEKKHPMYHPKQVRPTEPEQGRRLISALDAPLQSKFRAPPSFADEGEDPNAAHPLQAAANGTPLARQRRAWQNAARHSVPANPPRRRPVQIQASSGFPTDAMR